MQGPAIVSAQTKFIMFGLHAVAVVLRLDGRCRDVAVVNCRLVDAFMAPACGRWRSGCQPGGGDQRQRAVLLMTCY